MPCLLITFIALELGAWVSPSDVVYCWGSNADPLLLSLFPDIWWLCTGAACVSTFIPTVIVDVDFVG